MRLILVRHGETTHNVRGIMQGQMDTHLTEKGRMQARVLGEVLKNEKIDFIYASTLTRAIDTAKEIAKHHGLKICAASELNERAYGVLEGMEINEMKRRWPHEFEDGLEWEIFSRPEKGEHYWDVQSRAVPFIKKLAETHKGKTVVVVSHGDTNRVILTSLLGLKGADKYSVKQSNVCINEIFFEGGSRVRIHRLNDTAHLQHVFEQQVREEEGRPS